MTARWVTAGVGLALTAAVGVATVTVTLVEGGGPHEAPAVTPAPIDPGILRTWGLRLTPQGVLAPDASSAASPRTELEELYAGLLPPRPR